VLKIPAFGKPQDALETDYPEVAPENLLTELEQLTAHRKGQPPVNMAFPTSETLARISRLSVTKF
jgi:hypothetical protein